MLALLSESRRILKYFLPFLFISSLGNLVAGLTLEQILRHLELLPGLIAITPALMNMRGAIEGALAARLSTAYHLGMLKPALTPQPILKANLGASIILAAILAAFSALLGWLALNAIGMKVLPLPTLLTITLLAGIAAAAVLGLLTITLVITIARMGIDPENIMPIVTTVGDVAIILALLLVSTTLVKTGLI